ncbi:MAG TPA: ABC transporter ATP-binding protein [Candidatus Baltobacteraceae bacterium]|jgi:ABC-2 type transport system ATP-binding protein|nr:ABC transporter ATP-binding protein [Candidatus Baltobacteraceae bacterium]
MTALLELHDVRKSYGTRRAVDGLSLTVNRGEVVALLGANGAGKTTTLEIALGLRKADSGEVRLHARPVGVTPQETGMPNNLRVREIAGFVAKHYDTRPDVDAILAPFGLEAFANRQAGGLSGGELRKLALALAFAPKPELVILDEPTTGLDIESRRNVWSYVRAYVSGGGTVLLTTHHMEEAEALASRVCVMGAGRIVHDAPPSGIRRMVGTRRLTYAGEPFDPSTFGIDATVVCDEGRVTIAARDTDALVRAMVTNGIVFADLCVLDATLEDAVVTLTEVRR